MKKTLTLFTIGLMALYGCHEPQVQQRAAQEEFNIDIPDALLDSRGSGSRKQTDVVARFNEALFEGSNIRVSEVHICRLASADEARSVETLDRQFTTTLSERWVANDERRNWNGDGELNDLDWMAFPFFATANGTFNALPIYEAMYSKWETGGTCRTLDISQSPYDLSMGNPSLILGIGPWAPAAQPLADVSLVGFLPADIFEAVFGEPNILGVAFSFVFIDDDGNPIKSTRGKEDKAYSEVWFNDGFEWSQGTAPGKIDLASVILHEFGHTLNLGHFGLLQLITFEDGSIDLKYQPVNTMNAFYIGEPRDFLGENDKGNYCQAWGAWPFN